MALLHTIKVSGRDAEITDDSRVARYSFGSDLIRLELDREWGGRARGASHPHRQGGQLHTVRA